MTAEVAVMNKLAVALASDSAVTISAGGSHQKIFDSADKLFELSDRNAIGVMIYNTMDFMGTLLAVLVKDFRKRAQRFDTVKEAAYAFLRYLQEEGRAAPQGVKTQAIELALEFLLESIRKAADDWLLDQIRSGNFPKNPRVAADEHALELVKLNLEALATYADAPFLDDPAPIYRLDVPGRDALNHLVENHFGGSDAALKEALANFLTAYIAKDVFSPNRTGIVVAGFGENEKFPSLIWFETDGVLGGNLKFRESTYVDIDRAGRQSAILPFAQQDMVERFLYGLDAEIERDVTEFCGGAVPEIANSLLSHVGVPDSEKAALAEQARNAERAFLDQLRSSAFDKVRQAARLEIEGMIESMPKPEMAKMAEALIDLTSIKRRVSRGMETVGGPVDVAVISKAEGFVWVKRKHYFPKELNARHEARVWNGGYKGDA